MKNNKLLNTIYITVSSLLVTLIFSTLAKAEVDVDLICKDSYRQGYLQLSNSIDQFNEHETNKYEVATFLSLLSTSLTLENAACEFLSTPKIRKCYNGYRELYTELRSKISILAVLSNNQVDVTQGLFGLNEAKSKLKFEFLDMRCGYTF